MNLFIGTKLVKAAAMTRLEYNLMRGWTVPTDENPNDDGYLVEYIDGGKANHPAFDGYISWSPKDVFERANVLVGVVDDSPAHIVRVRAERAQLHDKLTKLRAFLGTLTFENMDCGDRALLERQAVCMADYLSILDSRLSAHNNPQGA